MNHWSGPSLTQEIMQEIKSSWIFRISLRAFIITAVIGLIIILMMACNSIILSSNDGPLGTVVKIKPDEFHGDKTWDSSNWLGSIYNAPVLSISWGIRMACFYPLTATLYFGLPLLSLCIKSSLSRCSKYVAWLCFQGMIISIASIFTGLEYDNLRMMLSYGCISFVLSLFILGAENKL